MNNTILIGRIATNLEVKTTDGGTSWCRFNLAVPRIGAKEGTQDVDFISVVVWNKQAENLAKYQSKGSLIAVKGEMRADAYTDKEGNKRTNTYVYGINIVYLGTPEKTSDNSIEVTENVEDPFKDLGDIVELTDEDLPF